MILKLLIKIKEKKASSEEEIYLENSVNKYKYNKSMYEKAIEEAANNIDEAAKIIKKNEINDILSMVQKESAKLKEKQQSTQEYLATMAEQARVLFAPQ